MPEEKRYKRLDEVTLMRTILAVLIVFMHSFTCYQGGWDKPIGYVDIPAYMWIARFSFAFTLEAFVFISGYLFAFQHITLNRRVDGISLVTNKLKRLILPSILFSALYFVLFYEYKGVGDLIYNLINGCGHMWFLPMSFWCFLGGWLLEKIKIPNGWKLAFLIILNLFFCISIPFQISRATKYLVYFYGGYLIYKHSENIKKHIDIKRIILLWSLFVVSFVLLKVLKENLNTETTSRYMNLLLASCGRACQLVYASIGTIAFYVTALYYTNHHKLRLQTVKLASCCFGIYLFQQFVLKGLYYETGFAACVGPYLLPWLGFLIAAPVSYLMTVLLLKTKVGKFLIG